MDDPILGDDWRGPGDGQRREGETSDEYLARTARVLTKLLDDLDERSANQMTIYERGAEIQGPKPWIVGDGDGPELVVLSNGLILSVEEDDEPREN